MMVFELLFVGLFLASLIALIGVLILAVRRRRRTAMRGLGVLGAGWAVYLFVVVAVAVTMGARPQRTIPVGQELCFDEMCFSVVNIQIVPQMGPASQFVKANGRFYVITVRVSSRSRGRVQSEGGLRALLWDSGKYYEVSSGGQQAWEAVNGETARLTVRLRPGESVQSVQVFDLPNDASAPGLALSHGFTPGYFVIGECPLFQKPTILKLAP
jgi:hypothetical protein